MWIVTFPKSAKEFLTATELCLTLPKYHEIFNGSCDKKKIRRRNKKEEKLFKKRIKERRNNEKKCYQLENE